MEPMELYIASIPFEDKKSQKPRPALVVAVKVNVVSIFKITSKYQNKSNEIKRLYYLIVDWKAAGLRKRSYVDTHRFYNLPEKFIFSHKPIGKLSTFDTNVIKLRI